MYPPQFSLIYAKINSIRLFHLNVIVSIKRIKNLGSDTLLSLFRLEPLFKIIKTHIHIYMKSGIL